MQVFKLETALPILSNPPTTLLDSPKLEY